VSVPNPDADIPRYADHCARQIAELIKYGPLTTLWGDVPYKALTAKEGNELVNWTRSLQPDILINNRFYGSPYDYITPEQKLGAFDNNKMWESCMCMGGCWSHIPDDAIKSARQCLHMLLGCACGGGNLLLDVGPDATGRIDPQEIANLRELGGWLEKYGESIYGTRGGPFKPGLFGGSTCKGRTVYLHIRHWIGDTLRLPAVPAKIVKAAVLTGGEAQLKQDDRGLTLHLDPQFRHPWDTVVALELDRPASEVPAMESGEGLTPTSIAAGKSFRTEHGATAAAADGDPRTQVLIGDKKNGSWLEVDLGAPTVVSAAYVQEMEGKAGCRVRGFAVQYEDNGAWKTCHEGKAIDGALTVEFPEVHAQKFRFLLTDAAKTPVGIAEFGLYHASTAE
jgi:alpha-L-fucosidase